MPFFLVNSVNSALVNGVSFSETTTAGIPCVENNVHKCSIVLYDVAALTACASIHLEYASAVVRNIFP